MASKPKKNEKVTITDIAERCHLSCAQISRALNDKYGVSEETRSKIRLIALEMGYNFKDINRNSPKANCKQISIVLPHENLLYHSFFSHIICSMEMELRKRDMNLSLVVAEEEIQSDLIGRFRREKTDGIIAVGFVSRPNIAMLFSSGIPLVLVDTPIHNIKANFFTANNFMGAFDGTDYLLQCGYRRLAFVGDVDFSHNFSERHRGFRRAIEQFEKRIGVAVEDTSVTSPSPKDITDLSFLPLDEKGLDALLSTPKAQLGILCANGEIAFHLYKAAAAHGWRIPDDLAVVSFDGTSQDEAMSPPLTAVHVPKEEMGQMAVKRLAEMLDNPAEKLTYKVEFAPYLIKRRSVREPDKTTDNNRNKP